ncbi:GNAT family N-acetyltransferase [Glaciimonas sp. PCH181]|uniref:GNAT family N-acetyltransferase n=1 Tax=Glaciimonas sp. PCH181 TaxID=2133943 RepID=UPI000D34D5DB|nr:GNAT family N-acetyltransferase [Glaciimonas sp. PCH181]PUA18547.1 histone acetyltransferase [Glaciimonas sp. PCH181]
MTSDINKPAFSVRRMSAEDVPALLQIQMACYPPSMTEPEAVILMRLQSSQQTCWLLEHDDTPSAYLFSYPSHRGMVTALNATFEVASNPDCLYLHDLAVSPRLRGQRAGQALVKTALAYARSAGLGSSALVAVQQSQPFWMAFGYSPHHNLSTEASKNLLSYQVTGFTNAIYMLQTLS